MSKYTDAKYNRIYIDIHDILIKRDTDLSNKCLENVLSNLVGSTILELGCGCGFLTSNITGNFKVTATDINIDEKLILNNQKAKFTIAQMEFLPFNDHSFDAVVTTHTSEHVRDIIKAISELRRVVRKRLIIIVPCQRPYRYTPDLHLHFFPYPESLLNLMANPENTKCIKIDQDLLYIQDF